VTTDNERPPAMRPRRALVALFDAIYTAPDADPVIRFQTRFGIAVSLLGILVALPGLAVSLVTGDSFDAILNGAWIVAFGLQLGSIQLGAPMAIVKWTMMATGGCLFLAFTVITRDLEPQQLFWLALLPLAAQAFAGARASDAASAGSVWAPVGVWVLVLAAGVLVIVAHQLGLTFDRPGRVLPRWALAVDFVMFTSAAYGLVHVYELSVREAQAELAQLRQVLSVCAWCRKVRDKGEWIPFERYLDEHRRDDLTHGICPSCLERQFGKR